MNEVSEAMLSLKGCNTSDLINLEKTVRKNVTRCTFCLASKAYAESQPVHRASEEQNSRELARVVASHELARDYSLIPHGVAGKMNLRAQFIHEEGFRDVSGKKGGIRKMQISGKITERNGLDGNHQALLTLRSMSYVCVWDRPPAWASPEQGNVLQLLTGCLECEALVGPAYEVGRKLEKPNAVLGVTYLMTTTC